MVSSGYKQSLYYGNETNYGSVATINKPIGLVQSINPTESNDIIKIRTLGGTRDYSNLVPGKFEVSGNFDYYLQDASFLRMAIGEDTATTSTIDSGPKIHTGASYLHIMGSAASPDSASFPSFTLEFADDEVSGASSKNLIRKFNGCRVNNLTISGTVDEPVSISCDWIAQSVHAGTGDATSVSESTKDPYVFYQGRLYSTSANISAYTEIGNADTICELNSFDMSISNDLEPIWYIAGTACGNTGGLRGLKSLVVKGRDMEANLGMHFTDINMYRRFLGSADAEIPQSTLGSYNIVLDFVRSGKIDGTKLETDDYIRLVLNGCKFNDINIAGAPEDLVSQNINVFVESAKVFVVDNISSYK